MQVNIELYTYSERSFVVKGDTKACKDELKALGGKFNACLTDRVTGEKFAGWIFPTYKQPEIQAWLDNITNTPTPTPTPLSFHMDEKKIIREQQAEIETLKKSVASLSKMMSEMKMTIQYIMTNMNMDVLESSIPLTENETPATMGESTINEEEEEEVHHGRMLSRRT